MANEVKGSESRSAMSDSLRPYGLYSSRISPGQNTGVDSFPFSRGSSQPRDLSQVSLIAGRFFTSWATREAHMANEEMFNSNNHQGNANQIDNEITVHGY